MAKRTASLLTVFALLTAVTSHAYYVPRLKVSKLYTHCSVLFSRCSVRSYSGADGFEGSGGVWASSSSAAALTPYPPPSKEKNHRIFTFRMDPTGQLRGSGPLDSPASYAAAFVDFIKIR